MATEKKSLKNKIDFAVIMSVEHANPNGDPLNGNRPRQTYDSIGEISDVCLKRKIRNRLLDMGESIFVQSDDKRKDECRSLMDRFKKLELKDDDNIREKVSEKWMDVRAFGQVFAFKKKDKKNGNAENAEEDDGDNGDAVSIGIRGPVTIQSAYSLETVTTDSMQITKSVNLETDTKSPDKKGPDTMGLKHRIVKGVYVTYGSINTQLAALTGFSDEDADKLKKAICSLFENDCSSARPDGSMEIIKVLWWKHNCPSGQYSSAKVHRALKDVIRPDGSFDENALRNALPALDLECLSQLEGDALK